MAYGKKKREKNEKQQAEKLVEKVVSIFEGRIGDKIIHFLLQKNKNFSTVQQKKKIIWIILQMSYYHLFMCHHFFHSFIILFNFFVL